MAAFQPDQPTDFIPGFQFLQYQLLEQIGYGGQGFVWSALDRTNDRIVAIKFNRMDSPDQKLESDAQFKHQAGQLMLLTHPNILPIYDFGAFLPYRYQVSPFLSGGSIQDRIFSGSLSIQESLDFSLRTASVLNYLHDKGIIHRDLKPSNILLDARNHMYVADFGLARIIIDTTQALHTGHGTPPYAPPEQHTLRELTYKSDIFSFGVMLFEMFTRQLPWDGEKSLGMQQVFTKEEIPDPHEINPAIPPGVVEVLRIMTSAKPENRYASAMAAMVELFKAFSMEIPNQIVTDTLPYEPTLEAGFLLQKRMVEWEPESGTNALSLTQFAAIDIVRRHPTDLPDDLTNIPAFMLQHALFYGYNDDYWWTNVSDPGDRLRFSLPLTRKQNFVINERVVRHLALDEQIRSLKVPLPESEAMAFLSVASTSEDPVLRARIFDTLKKLAPLSNRWRPTALGKTADLNLASLALDPAPVGDYAATLIGDLRSTTAAESILEAPEGNRRNAALMAIQQSAGSLPESFPANIRLEITGIWLTRRLFNQPLRLLSVYGWIVLGIALSVGLQTYLAYRFPQFLDTLRFLRALEHGAILGLILGVGILTTRVIVERFPEFNGFLRMVAALLFGGILINLAFFIFDVLMNSLVPAGILVTTGSLLIAAGYGLGGLVKTRLVKILITSVFVGVAIAGSWAGHVLLSQLNIAMSPIFFYEYSWTTVQIFTTILAVTIPMSILGNLGDLSPSSRME